MDIIQKRSRFSLAGLFRKDSDTLFDGIIQTTIIFAVFLTPLFFLTVTRNIFDLNKSLLFCLLTLVGLIAWLGKIVFRKGFRFRRTILDVPLVIFGLLYILVTFFSKNWFVSVAGTANYYHHALIVVLFLIFFYFLVVNNVRTLKQVVRVLSALLISGGLVALISLFQVFKVYLFAAEATKSISFNPIFNSSVVQGVFLSLMLVLGLALLIPVKKPASRWLLGLSSLLDFVVLLVIDLNFVWYVLIGLLFVFILFLTLRSRELESRWAILPTVLLILAVILTFVDASSLTGVSLPDDIILDQKTSWEIAQGTLRQLPLFGTGPEMFSWAFASHRPTSFNDTALWNLNFIKASSEFLQLLVTTGILTTIVLIWLSLRYGLKAVRQLIKDRGDQFSWFVSLATALVWLALFVVQFFFPFSFVLCFIFWLFLALGVSLLTKESGEVLESAPSPAAGFFSSIAFSMLVVLGLAFLYGAATFWLADFHFVKAAKALSAQNFNKAMTEFNRAIDLNGREPAYFFALGQTFIQQASVSPARTQAELDNVRQLITLTSVAGRNGLNIDMKDALTYQDFLNLSATLRIYDANVSSQLVEHYDKLIELDPNNPLNYMAAGDNAIAAGQALAAALEQIQDENQKSQAQQQINDYYAEAVGYYNKAADLKKDYIIAQLKKALTSELAGNRDQAITEVEALAKQYPSSTDALYELGRLYVAADQKDKAKGAFVAVLNLSSQHANAAYQLAEIVLAEGDKETAKALFLRVYQNNPDNEQVRSKLTELGVNLEELSKTTQ